MAKDNSFDAVVETDMQEMDNAVNQSMKEIANRWDFRGSKSKIELDKTAERINLLAEDDMKLQAMKDILIGKMVKRGVEPESLKWEELESAAGTSLRQVAQLLSGIPQDKAKELVKAIKESKIKVQASIQGDKIRVSAKSRDLLQEAQVVMKKADVGIALTYTNYR